MKILIADDESTTRLILKMMLKENYFNVVGEAADGVKALELYRELKPDIVFLDINMPKLDGHQATEAIRKENVGTGIIIVSALATAQNVKHAIQAGANGFIVKPFSTTRVIEAIDLCRKIVG